MHYFEESDTDSLRLIEQPDNSSPPGIKGLSDDDYIFDELRSVDSEDDDGGVQRVSDPTFNMPKSMAEYKWELGTLFKKKNDFKNAIRICVVHSMRALRFKKNDNKRVIVK